MLSAIDSSVNLAGGRALTSVLRAAAVQLTATPDKARNLETADRLVRRAAQDGARLVVLPEKWSLLGRGADLRDGAEPLDGPAVTWARDAARELGIDLVAGSVAERVAGEDKLRNTSLHIGPDGEVRATYRKLHMFDVEVDGTVYRESDHEAPGDDVVLSATADGVELGLTVCYDVRFPELYRILAVRGARIVTIPAAFTVPTTRDHWEVLVRARAIEDQCFVDRRQPGRRARRGASVRRALDDRGPVGPGPRPGRRLRDRDHRRPRPRRPGRDPHAPARARQPPPRGLPLAGRLMAARNEKLAAEKRRLILDAAVRVFARQGFNQCRVSDIADEAGVAYGLVYHYFRSKDEVLDTLFLERWNVMLDVIRDLDGQDLAARDKLYAIASFIVDSYRHDPELMKVIIVEVTRAANSFGQTHLEKITEAYELIAGIVERAQAEGAFKDTVTPRFAAMAFYGAIEQVLSGWIFETLPRGDAEFEEAKTLVVETICGGLDAAPATA